VLLFAVAALVGIGFLLSSSIAGAFDDVAGEFDNAIDEIERWLQEGPLGLSANDVDSLSESIADVADRAGSGLLDEPASTVRLAAEIVGGIFLMAVVLFFFLKDGPVIWRFVLRPFQGEHRARAERIGGKTVETLGSYVRGTATVALVDAVAIGIGLVILQVPLALPLAVLVFLLSFIPMVGATVAGVLAALVALVANGPLSAVIVVILVVGVNQLEGNFLQPVVMGRALKLHALVILLALTIGTVLAGILGAVLAVPIAAVVWGIVKVWDGPDTPARWARPSPDEL
jgi:predicted PurR-regulated permease PerM